MRNSGTETELVEESFRDKLPGLISDSKGIDDFSSNNQIENGSYESLTSTSVEDMIDIINFINGVEGREQDYLQPTDAIELFVNINDDEKQKEN